MWSLPENIAPLWLRQGILLKPATWTTESRKALENQRRPEIDHGSTMDLSENMQTRQESLEATSKRQANFSLRDGLLP